MLDQLGASLSSGGLASNYKLVGGNHTVTFTARPVTAVFTAADKEYDRTTTAQVTGSSADLIAGDDVAIGHGAANFASRNVGANNTVTVTGAQLAGSDAANYTLQNTAVTTSAAITPRRLTVAGLSASDREYDATTTVQVSGLPGLTGGTANANGIAGSFSGVFSGDALTVSMANPNQVGAVFANKNAGVAKAINLTGVTLSGADAANYTVNAVRGVSATVTPRSLIVTGLVAFDKVFDGTLAGRVAGTPSFSGVIAGDNLQWLIGNVGASFLDTAIGTNKPLNLLGIQLLGADAGNYSVNRIRGLWASILPVPLPTPTPTPGGGGGTPFVPLPPALLAFLNSPNRVSLLTLVNPALVRYQASPVLTPVTSTAQGSSPVPVNPGGLPSPYPLTMAFNSGLSTSAGRSGASTGATSGSASAGSAAGVASGTGGSAAVSEGPLQPTFRVENQRSERYSMGQGTLLVAPGQDVCLAPAGCGGGVNSGTPPAPGGPAQPITPEATSSLTIEGVDNQARVSETPAVPRLGSLHALVAQLALSATIGSTPSVLMASSLLRPAAAALSGAALLLGGSGLMAPARALPEAEVSAKLDTILLLMAVNDKGQPRPVPAKVDGRTVNAYLAAISIAAAEEITAGKRYGLDASTAKGLRFAPVSLARFNLLLAPLLKAKPKDLGVIAPDPAQVAVAEKLLVAQNVPAAQASQVAALQPMIFCPEPGLLVSSNEGPEKGKQFVPCATEAEFVEGIVQRAIKESPQIAATKPKVVAIPLNSFITFLRNEPESRVGQLRVVPSGRMVNLIQQISRQQQPAPTGKPAQPATSPAAKPAAQ